MFICFWVNESLVTDDYLWQRQMERRACHASHSLSCKVNIVSCLSTFSTLLILQTISDKLVNSANLHICKLHEFLLYLILILVWKMLKKCWKCWDVTVQGWLSSRHKRPKETIETRIKVTSSQSSWAWHIRAFRWSWYAIF